MKENGAALLCSFMLVYFEFFEGLLVLHYAEGVEDDSPGSAQRHPGSIGARWSRTLKGFNDLGSTIYFPSYVAPLQGASKGWWEFISQGGAALTLGFRIEPLRGT